jgi:ABC-type transport system involved in multi-copper enzyme maturation permease subunit
MRARLRSGLLAVLRRPLNPVLARELKERMRRRRSALVLTVYLVLLTGALWILYLGAGSDLGGPGALRLASLGRAAFHTLLFTMLVLVCFIVPALAAGGIAGERERRTLASMQVTLLGPWSILAGKLASSLVFVTYLIVATLPLFGVSFLLGGVEPGEVVRGVAMVLAVAATLGSLALTCSTLMRRVQGATVVSYALVALLGVGTFVAFGAQMLIDRDGPEGRAQLLLALNPLMATADVLGRSPNENSVLPSPFMPLQELIELRERPPDQEFGISSGPGFGGMTVATAVAVDASGDMVMSEPAPVPIGPNGAPVPFDGSGDVFAAPWRAPLVNRIPMWALALAGYGLLSLGGLTLAARRLATPAREER